MLTPNTQNSGECPYAPAPLLDARGLACPMPLLKAKLALHPLAQGEYLRVFATDAGSVRDFHAFARLSAHDLVFFAQHADYFEYVWRKG